MEGRGVTEREGRTRRADVVDIAADAHIAIKYEAFLTRCLCTSREPSLSHCEADALLSYERARSECNRRERRKRQPVVNRRSILASCSAVP